jgi:glucan phosphorylase
MNEGHSAFFQLERLRELVEETQLTRDAALQRLRASTVFTTHTPVPAGNEIFDARLVERNVGHLVTRCGFTWTSSSHSAASRSTTRGFGLTPFAPDVDVRERRLRAARRGVA